METPATIEPTTFLERALPYAKLGIPVFPLMPREKCPPASMTAWPELATTDLAQIAAWNDENPDYNCALVAGLGRHVFLEFDVMDGMEAAAAEMGEAIPGTRAHRSGRGFAHWLFLATADSDRLGNRSANLDNGHEWFSFRADRRYLVGPGSVHPNGGLYTVIADVAPTSIPNWVCRWVEKHSQDNSRAKEAIAVAEDFNFDEFLSHYGIDIVGGKDGWHTTRECPVAGYRHQNSTNSGFYYDGSTLGWKCFAQGCDGSSMSIGQVIRCLNQDHAPYLGPIWEGNGDDHGLSDWAEDVMDDMEDLPVTTPVIGAPELLETFARNGVPGNVLDKPAPPDQWDPDRDEDERIATIAPPPKLPIPKRVEIAVTSIPGLDFDPRALYGKLGEIASQLASAGLPLGYVYPAILTIASALDGVEDTSNHTHKVRSNLYTALLGKVGQGKTAVVNSALKAIFLPEGTDDWVVPSSDRGLAKQCGDQGYRKLLIQDEYRATLQKCNLQGSSLPQLFNTLWNYDKAGAADKKGVEQCFARLSVLGNLTVDDPADFAKIFGASSISGMVDRHIFGYCDKRVKFRPFLIKQAFLQPNGVVFPNWVWDAKDEWLGEVDERSRLTEHMLRVALVQSCCNGDHEITKESLEAAMRFAEWQERLRGTFQAGLAENPDAICYSAIHRALEDQYDKQQENKVPPKGADKFGVEKFAQLKLLHFPGIMRSKSYYRRFGSLMINRVKMSMINEGLLREVKEETVEELPDGRTKTRPGKKSNFVCLLSRAK
jgi:hypothetical protein